MSDNKDLVALRKRIDAMHSSARMEYSPTTTDVWTLRIILPIGEETKIRKVVAEVCNVTSMTCTDDNGVMCVTGC